MKIIALLIVGQLLMLALDSSVALEPARFAASTLQHVADALDHVNHG